MYQGYVSSVCIKAMFLDYVCGLCVKTLNRGYVSRQCMWTMYQDYVCTKTVYLDYVTLYLGYVIVPVFQRKNPRHAFGNYRKIRVILVMFIFWPKRISIQ